MRRLLYLAFWILVSFLVFGCGASSTSTTAGTGKATGASGTEPQPEAEELDPELVGAWRGYWSPKGCARTESHLFFPDGSWKWRATFSEKEHSADRIAERSGRWERRGSVLALTETGYRELFGCRDEAGGGDSAADAEPTASSACDEPRYRQVQHPTPVLKEITLGDCPPNREAETLDASYLCRSIGGQAFWRRPLPEIPEEGAGKAAGE